MDHLFENQKEAWDKHFKNFVMEYPDEEVVRFLNRINHTKKGGTLVDMGCSTGRNAMVALRFGFQVVGIDYVQHCLDVLEKKAMDEGYSGQIRLIKNETVDIPLPDQSADALLAWGMCFYNRKEDVKRLMKEIYRVLKVEGEVFCDFRTQFDTKYVEGRSSNEFEKNTILLTKELGLEGGYCWIPPYEELEALLTEIGFQVESRELFEFTYENMRKKNSWWHLILKK